PDKEFIVAVMNTVILAMALHYPPEKLHLYLSDDGGSPLTLHGMRKRTISRDGGCRFARGME
ncbi:hypothetical protein ACJRO7_019736, partial [Eucalyptus globulus]